MDTVVMVTRTEWSIHQFPGLTKGFGQ